MLWLRVDRDGSTPLIRQIYLAIRKRILSGQLPQNDKLPSSRELSRQLQVSRNVVLEAYDLLYAEGFLTTCRGAGTFVAGGAVFRREEEIEPPVVEQVGMGYDAGQDVINFRAGTPDLSLFPVKTWQRMVKEVFDTGPTDMLAYGHPEGRRELREAICEYVVSQREVVCHPDQIVVTAGTTQAIGIVCRLLQSAGNMMVVEDPITNDIREISQSCGFQFSTVPVDDEGMRTDLLPREASPACIYVTPSHQFPIGGTLPIQRRIELLEYARYKECYVIEDDYDSEFRFDGPPLSALHGLSPKRVIYIGTFSKTLCPGIRVGYLVLPHELIQRGRSRKWQSDLHNEVTSQLALARFVASGHYLRHVNRMRKHYLARRITLAAALRKHFGDTVEILGSEAGLHLVARFPGVTFDEKLLERIEKQGARFYPVAIHSLTPESHLDKLLIGYGNLGDADIRQGVELLARCLRECSG